MPWSVTADVAELLGAAGEFLGSEPVLHSPLLTEADHLSRRPDPPADQAHGWWTDDAGVVRGAFVRAPRHPTLLAPMPPEAVETLVELLGPLGPEVGIGCDITTADDVIGAFERTGVLLRPRGRFVLHRLDAVRPSAVLPGVARAAGPDDHALVDGWFDLLLEAHPGDPSDRSYVVDDPLADGRITLWEVDGEPVAMAGRTPTLAGMTRISAVFAPSGDERAEAAVLAAATNAAAEVADDVVVLAATGDRDGIARLAALGYRAVRERVLLARATSGG
ncbi:hypothetical protein [Nocardioides stalactiti]|uniref:hypothetical protein n=1 Tax=Nocardioides stalactiti TaxID=2755356 RepID=UPI001603548E|nr:hypothetical protein [Nocardioides stalactiti]